jgi:hypothetical protein
MRAQHEAKLRAIAARAAGDRRAECDGDRKAALQKVEHARAEGDALVMHTVASISPRRRRTIRLSVSPVSDRGARQCVRKAAREAEAWVGGARLVVHR